MWEVRFEVRFQFNPRFQDYVGWIKVFLPTVGGEEIPLLLQNIHQYIWDEPLSHMWGRVEEREGKKWRVKEWSLRHEDPEILEQKIGEKIKETLEALREVYKKNKEKLAKTPKDKKYSFVIK